MFTSFRLYFPRVLESAEHAASRIFSNAPPGFNPKNVPTGRKLIRKINTNIQDLETAKKSKSLHNFDFKLWKLRQPETLLDLHKAEKMAFRIRKGLGKKK